MNPGHSKNKRTKIVLTIGFIVLLAGGLLWYWFSPTGPMAYVGVREMDCSGAKHFYKMPSWVAEVDLGRGKVVDTFPLTTNVPIVRDIAVDWKRNKLYAVGDVSVGLGRAEKYETTRGIDIYDLETRELVDQIDFDTDRARIRLIRFNPRFDKLFLDNPLRKKDRPKGDKEKLTWVFNPFEKKLIYTTDASITYDHIISPSGKISYRFWPKSEFESIGSVDAGKIVYSHIEERKLLETNGATDLIQTGGWQPDPEGKYEQEPFTLGYPQMWGRNPIGFYNRKTLEKIGEVSLDQEGYEVSGGGGGYQETITKDNRYMVSTVKIRPEGSEDPGTAALKVIDIENQRVIHTIPIGEEITAVDVEWQ